MKVHYRVARRTLLRLVPRLASLLFVLHLAGCAPSQPPGEAVRLWLADAQAAVETRDRQGLLDMVSPAYADARGNGRDGIDRLLRGLFLRNRNILVLSKVDELNLIGDPATASAATVLLTAGMAGANAGARTFSADAYRIELELVKDDERWLLIGARWGAVGEALR